MKHRLFGVAIASLMFAASLTAAPSTQSSIVLNPPTALRTAQAAAWEPALGDTVSFTASFPTRLDSRYVNIQLLCYQGGAVVFATAGRHDLSFKLGGSSSPWLTTGGAANCHADLYYWGNGGKFVQLAYADFTATGW